jgi:hypothetical protein
MHLVALGDAGRDDGLIRHRALSLKAERKHSLSHCSIFVLKNIKKSPEIGLDHLPNIRLYSAYLVPFEGRLERHEAGGGVRWPRQGAKRTPAPRRPKPQGPDAPAAHHGDRAANAARRLTARHLARPHSGGEALGPENLKRERRLKSQPTGGSAEQAKHTARGMPDGPAHSR